MGVNQRIDFRPAMRSLSFLPVLFWLAVFGSPARAQTAAETAGATSVSSAVAANAKPIQMPAVPTGAGHANGAPGQSGQAPPYILSSSSSTTTVEANRHALEAKAGPDAARLLVRSTPSSAQVWIDNQPVGSTPLLLIIPPGKYMLELRGSRQEAGRKELALLPKETREVTVKLELRYPTRVLAAH